MLQGTQSVCCRRLIVGIVAYLVQSLALQGGEYSTSAVFGVVPTDEIGGHVYPI